MVLAVARDLVRTDDIPGSVVARVDGDSFAIGSKPVWPKCASSCAASAMVGVRMILVDAVALVRIVDIPERIIHRDRFDLAYAAERPK